MEINVLEERSDGYTAYCVILAPQELEVLKAMRDDRDLHTDEYALEAAISVGLGL